MAAEEDETAMPPASIKQSLPCAICCGAPRDSRLLPCLHSFCRECIDSLMLSCPQPARCPLCRAVFSCPSTGAAGLARVCSGIRTQQQAISSHSGGHENCIFCDQCDDSLQERAWTWCSECAIPLCRDHGTLHRKTKGCRGHTLTALHSGGDKSTGGSDVDNRCSKHDEILKMYCTTCQEVICCECAVREHPFSCSGPVGPGIGYQAMQTVPVATRPTTYHSVEFLNELVEKRMKNVSGLITELSGSVEDVRKSVGIIAKATERSQRNTAKAKEAIKSTFQRIIQALTEQQAKLLGQVDELEERHEKLLNQQREEAQSHLDGLLVALEFGQVVTQEPDIGSLRQLCETLLVVENRLSQLRFVNAESLASPLKASPSVFFVPGQGDRLEQIIERLGSVEVFGRPCARFCTVHERSAEPSSSVSVWNTRAVAGTGASGVLYLFTKDAKQRCLPFGGATVVATARRKPVAVGDLQRMAMATRATENSEVQKELTVKVVDNDNGSYALEIPSAGNGCYRLSVLVDGVEIKGSPMDIYRLPWVLQTPRISDEDSSVFQYPGVSVRMSPSADSAADAICMTAHRSMGRKAFTPVVGIPGLTAGKHKFMVRGAWAIGVATTCEVGALRSFSTLEPPSRFVWCWMYGARYTGDHKQHWEAKTHISSWEQYNVCIDCDAHKVSISSKDCQVIDSFEDLPGEILYPFFALYVQDEMITVTFD